MASTLRVVVGLDSRLHRRDPPSGQFARNKITAVPFRRVARPNGSLVAGFAGALILGALVRLGG